MMLTMFASKRVATSVLRTSIASVQRCQFSNAPDKLKEKSTGEEKSYFSQQDAKLLKNLV